jgi:addiction module HigA family antidote
MPSPTIHPGEILADELGEIGVTASGLARQIEIIRGRRGITGDTALRLGRWFGTAPLFWTSHRAA